ncbi:hypothetical protein ACQJBY_032512 [Aegilops geniculata]
MATVFHFPLPRSFPMVVQGFYSSPSHALSHCPCSCVYYFDFFMMEMLLMNILCSKKLQKKSVFLVAKISEFCSGLAVRHVFYFSSVCHFSLIRRSIMYISFSSVRNIRDSTHIIMSHKFKYMYRSFSP